MANAQTVSPQHMKVKHLFRTARLLLSSQGAVNAGAELPSAERNPGWKMAWRTYVALPLQETVRKRVCALGGLWVGMVLSVGMLACSAPDEFPPEEFGWKSLDVQVTGPRVESAMSWDPGCEKFFLHGGRDGDWDFRPQTWAWSPDSPAWVLVVGAGEPSPGARTSHTMVWDSKRERMVLFGGTDFDDTFNDTWAFDGPETRWAPLETLGPRPSPRFQHGMVYDPVTDQVMIFGGRGPDQELLHDTWLLEMDGLRWSRLDSSAGAVHPEPQDHVKMAHDTLSGVTVLSGDPSAANAEAETWHFDFRVPGWIQAKPVQGPQEMDHGFLCPVETLGGLLLLGFEPGHRNRPSTWLYRPQSETWTLLRAGASPPDFPLDHGQVASDGQHFYLLAGFNPGLPSGGPGVFPRGSMWRY